MKLKDEGTIIHNKVERKTFKGKQYLVLKATYKKEVGKDTWYFYFNPKTFAMEVYQFFHDESKNDGEYILLTEEETIKGVKMPKNRAWFMNKEDTYLGTDVLSKTN
jgi:phosphoserine aminotransferase